MFCRSCAKEVSPQAVACPACGFPPLAGTAHCQNCAAATQPGQVLCTACGFTLQKPGVIPGIGGGQKSKLVAGLLGILLGGFGVHRFYLGFTTIGIIQIVVTIVTCGAGALWGLVEGILILVGKMDRDAAGMPLGE